MKPPISLQTEHVRAGRNGAFYFYCLKQTGPTDTFDTLKTICRHIYNKAAEDIFFTQGHMLADCHSLENGLLEGTKSAGYHFEEQFKLYGLEFRLESKWRAIKPDKCYLAVVVSALRLLAKRHNVDITAAVHSTKELVDLDSVIARLANAFVAENAREFFSDFVRNFTSMLVADSHNLEGPIHMITSIEDLDLSIDSENLMNLH